MTISVGDRLPDAELRTMTPDGPSVVKSSEVLGTGKVVLFAVPGAFTPGCSNVHLPGFVERADELKARGVTTIACVAVNDPFVMDAWGKAHGADDILLLSDGNGQILVVTAGRGWVCSQGEEPQVIRAGDVVWVPPGERHWHGGTADTVMTHLAVSLGPTVWLDEVAEDDYRGAER